jgi:hypothetical protein
MLIPKQTAIPSLVRLKPGALDRMGIYAEGSSAESAAESFDFRAMITPSVERLFSSHLQCFTFFG